ncbi:MAG: response regulator [Deltaproteobacteria bacterium]|nr:response regulator [Deltaproteobacteria bacterium]
MEQSKPKTILIVEDDQAVRQGIAEVVQFCGWQVIEASNGVHGLELFKIHLPDIVLTDVVMDGLDGFQLTARIKSINPRAAVILMTAFSTPNLREKVQSVGASKFLCKPFEPEELLLALTRSLGSSASNQK